MTRPVPEYIKVRTFVYKLAMRAQGGNGKLPSENELCAMFNVSRITVREALQELVRSKTIMTKRGMGTFVHPEFGRRKLSPWCIGYLRFGGRMATNQISGLFSDCIEMLGLDYEMLFHSDSKESEKQLLETIRSLSGIVWDGYEHGTCAELAEQIRSTGTPLLLLTKQEDTGDIIFLNAEQEGKEIASYAKCNGHENILFISVSGSLPFEQYCQANPTYPATYRELSGKEEIPMDRYCSLTQFEKIAEQKDFPEKYTMIYSRRSYVRSVMDTLNKNGIRVPEDVSYLVFDEPTSHLFNGLSPSYIDSRDSLREHILNWLERRIIQGDKDGVFSEKQIVKTVCGDSVKDILN